MSTLTEARKVLVISGNTIKFADYLGLTVIVKNMLANGAQVDLCQLSPWSANFNTIVSFPEVKKVDKLPARKFILSFDKGSDVVKNIQWQQSDKKINFHIFMENGQFKPEGLQVDTEGADYDTILYYKVTNFAEAQKCFVDFPNAVREAKNVSIHQEFSIENAQVEVVKFADAAGHSETVYLAAKQWGLDAESSSLLLAAILDSTARFKNNVGMKTFAHCTDLATSGASIDMANNLLERSKADKPGSSLPAEASAKAGNPETGKKTTSQPTSKPSSKETSQLANQPTSKLTKNAAHSPQSTDKNTKPVTRI